MLQQPARSIPIPPLESGDRLTRAEFERRYDATSEKFKAELIEGVVYVASPVRVFHSNPHFNLITWLGVYSTATPGVSGSDNATIRLDLDNEPQPDALLRIEIGGTSTISEDGYIEGTPELVAEIATSSAAIDLGSKRNVYRRNGVQEYLVWQTFENRFSWFRLQAEEFVLIEPDADGMIRSSVFPFFVAGGVVIIGGQHDGSAECAASRDWRSETSGICSGVGRAIVKELQEINY